VTYYDSQMSERERERGHFVQYIDMFLKLNTKTPVTPRECRVPRVRTGIWCIFETANTSRSTSFAVRKNKAKNGPAKRVNQVLLEQVDGIE